MLPFTLLQRISLFKGLDRSALKELADSFVLETCSKNQEILSGAESARRFMIIVTGRVKIISSERHNGRELTLWLLGPGDAFNVVGLLDGEPHAVSARTLDDVKVLCAPCALFREWIERYPPLRAAMLRYAARQLRDLTDLASDLALSDTMTRLAHLLLRHLHADSRKASQNSLIDSLSHEEIASLIGSVRVVVNRLLVQLRKEGAVAVKTGRLQIANLQRLLRHAEQRAKSQPPSSGTHPGRDRKRMSQV